MIMAGSLFRVVLDMNVLLAGLVSESSASQRSVDLLMDRRAVPLISPLVMAEYQAILLHADIAARFPNLTPRRVAMALHRLRYVADEYQTSRVKFEFPRDPKDARFIELAIAGSATHVVTLDPDLLSLPAGRTDASKRFRQRLGNVEVLRPGIFLDRFERTLDT
jgi:putative PIN family toxin of toxin-antitoxin system